MSKWQSPIEQQVYLSEQRVDFDVPENSHRYVQLRLESENCKFVGTLNKNARAKVFVGINNWRNCQLELEFNLHESAELEVVCFVGKCRRMRLNQRMEFLGEHSSAILYNACKICGGENIEIQTSQTHLAPGSRSAVETNSVLDGRSTVNVSGIINVLESSHESESEQYTKAVTLSDNAEATMTPCLNILANDVACKHGAACGGLDEESVLYAQSRGIPLAQVKEMLADGFMFSGFENFKHHFWETCLSPLKENS